MEIGPVERVLVAPFHPYTHTLLHAVPVPFQPPASAAGLKAGEPKRGGARCVSAGRCPWQVGEVCETARRPVRESAGGLQLRCHHTVDALNALADWPRKTVIA